MGKKDGKDPNRNAKGHFAKGNTLSRGRPKSSGKLRVQELCWEQINRLAEMMFKWPNDKLEAFVEQNKNKLTRAEIAYFNASRDVKTLEMLLDRIIPKTMAIDATLRQKDPIIERLYELPPGGVDQEIEELLEARNTINAEYKDVTPNKEED